jgi:hypothetical protein
MAERDDDGSIPNPRDRKPGALTRRIKKLLGPDFLHIWEIFGPHAPDDDPKEEKPRKPEVPPPTGMPVP